MALQIEPYKKFPITWNVPDPTDTNTYYVRSYIYDHDGTLLDTINLTDQTGGRFLYEYYMPADPTGEGRHITVWTKIFTDSGYTTESQLYSRRTDEYLVKQGYNPVYGGGGGGTDVSYKKIRQIIKEEIDKLPRPIKPEKVNLNPILSAILAIRIPEPEKPEKFDYNLILKRLKEVQVMIGQEIKNIPQPERVDLSPVVEAVNNLQMKDVKTALAKDAIENKTIIQRLQEMVNAMAEKFEQRAYITLPQTEVPKQDKKAYRKYL